MLQCIYTLPVEVDQLQCTLGTAAWKRNSVMGVGVELVAVSVIAVTTGLLGLLSNENTTFRPFFSNAVMLGIPTIYRKYNCTL